MRRLLTLLSLLTLALNVPAQRAHYAKMSSWVRQTVRLNPTLTAAPAAPSRRDVGVSQHPNRREAMLTAFVKTTGEDSGLLSSYGCRPLAQFGDIAIASIPLSQLTALARHPSVLRIEANSPCTVHTDTMAAILNATPAYEGLNLPQAYTGKGVIVGVQDIAFDLTHPNFYSRDVRNYRIKRFWDMLSVDTLGSSLPVGADYVTEGALLDYARARDSHLAYHGTHTSGIAAGSGYTTPYVGIAYESDLCLVANATSTDVELIDSIDRYKYTSAMDVLGFKYIFDYAESVGKPCVINFSEGSHQDMDGENQLLYEVLDQLTGPGRIIVASAGNDGYHATYFRKPRGVASAGTFLEGSSHYAYFMLRADKPFELRSVVYGPENRNDTIMIASQWPVERADSEYVDTLNTVAGQMVFDIMGYPSCYDNDKMAYEMVVLNTDNTRLGRAIPFSLEVVGAEADVEFFLCSGWMITNERNARLSDGEKTHSIHFPGSAPSVVCVGSTGYRTTLTNLQGETTYFYNGTDGERSPTSSVGPTLDYRVKPDVMAPGANIISSMNSYYREANPDKYNSSLMAERTFGGRTYHWLSDAGTSMSAPAVTGGIALWLQACPWLTPQQVKDVLANTCYRYDTSLSYPNNLYGYGQIDIYRGLLYLLKLDGIESLSARQPAQTTFRLVGRRLQMDFAKRTKAKVCVSVYATNGQLKSRSTLPANGQGDSVSLDLETLPPGVYAVQVDTGEAETSGSTLIRLD